MLYVGIDQHRKQLTVSVRDESGNVVLRRQVSTEWTKVHEFFEDLRERSSAHGGYMAVVEVCGFNEWLLKCQWRSETGPISRSQSGHRARHGSRCCLAV